MVPDPVVSGSLPQTVAARRNARLRAAAFATIPLLLFVIAMVPRVWAPDLVPFGLRQAASLEEASRRGPVSLLSLYADRSVTPLMLADPVLRQLPSRIALWVILRGLLDSLGVALLYLAARPLVGRPGAMLAAAIYAASPVAWAASRDPSGPLGAMLAAAALWGAVQLLRRPTLLRAAVFGGLLGLLARSVSPPLLVVALGAMTLALARASWRAGGVTALALVVLAGPALYARLEIVRGGPFAATALALPGWLIAGLAYRLPDGHALGTTVLPVWGGWLVAVTVGLLVFGAAYSLWLAWRGRTALLLAMVWCAGCWIGAVLALQAGQMLGPAGSNVIAVPAPSTTLALVPGVALLIVAPVASLFRVVRLGGLAGSVLVLALSISTVGVSINGIAVKAAEGGGLTAPPVQMRDAATQTDARSQVGVVGLGTRGTLREWSALAEAVGQVAARTEADEVLVAGDRSTAVEVLPLQALLRGSLRVRRTEAAVVLPLERETVFVVASAAPMPVELRRASSMTRAHAHSGVDTGFSIQTLRPRPAADWLARTRPIADGRFADGSALLGIVLDRAAPEQVDVFLYWSLPVESSAGAVGESLNLTLQGAERSDSGHARQLPLSARRAGELTVTQFTVADAALGAASDGGVLVVVLSDQAGQPIRTVDGGDQMAIPLSRRE